MFAKANLQNLIIASTKSCEIVTTQSSNVADKIVNTNLCLWHLLPGYSRLEIIQHPPFIDALYWNKDVWERHKAAALFIWDI